MSEARRFIAEVLPADQLPSALCSLHQHSSQPLRPIEVAHFWKMAQNTLQKTSLMQLAIPECKAPDSSIDQTVSSACQGLKRGCQSDLRYKGEWMRRPLASSEIGWLVRLLVALSEAANRYLELEQPLPEDSSLSKQPSFRQVHLIICAIKLP